ncbi:MAG: PD-(D/E)XK nuclease family protein [Pseudomonadota bacterium]
MLPAVGYHQRIKLSPTALIDGAAEEIARHFIDKLPDLSSLIVLLPTVQAAVGFKQALRRAVGCDVLLLPRILTLASFAETGFFERPIAPPSLRLVQLYTALRARDWFDTASLWRMSAELAQLFDELTLAQRDLPDSIEEFVFLLEKSYQAKADAAMRFEARLAHEMWYAFNRAEALDPESPLTAAAAYELQLAFLAKNARDPLCVIGVDYLAPIEAVFLRKYAERQLVLEISADCVSSDSLTSCLSTAWAGGGNGEEQLRSRAKSFAQRHPNFLLATRLNLYAALHLEDEATAAAAQIRTWLIEGKRNIALVAADRLAVRRVRALLERDSILLTDESGWTMSTTSASTIIMRLLETLGDGFYHRDVLDLVKSPFFATDWLPERRKRAVHQLERWMHEHNIVAGLDRYRALASRYAPHGDEEEIVNRLGHASGKLKVGALTLANWIERLLEALTELGAMSGLEGDAAGRQLLKLLAQRSQELTGNMERIGFQEWRRWLNVELEAAVFRDDTIISPVIITSLSATRLRQFDAVVLVGADAAHLNPRAGKFRLLNQAVRRDLMLPSTTEAALQLQEDLINLIARSGSVLMTWQASKDGEHNAMSPWLARLETFHTIAYDKSLLVHSPAIRTGAQAKSNLRSPPPAPTVPICLLPRKISASGYGSLMACPYQFFGRYVLALNTQGEVAEEMEKRDYGELVHEVLARFHEQYPSVSALTEDEAEVLLRRVTNEVFKQQIDNDYASVAWKFRWEKRISAYLSWHRQWEAEGWLFDAAEKKVERSFALDESGEVILQGRLDRIDRNVEGSRFAVLDYKTQKRKLLVDKLVQPGEDVQLAVYALLLGESTAAAAYVSLDDDKVTAVTVGESLPALAAEAGDRLNKLFNNMAKGEVLPANGAPSTCRYCEMRGLCRLDYWEL